MIGTASQEQAYLIVELRKPWPAKIKKAEGVIEELRRTLKKHHGEEVTLLATPEIPWLETTDSNRALLIRWNGTKAVCKEIEPTSPSLTQALAQRPGGEVFECHLVCTHGSRDPCCGVLGFPVFQALSTSSRRRVLQVSHLGGHRFAPVLLSFPEWRFYGRLTPQEAKDMDQALSENRFYANGYRGNGRLTSRMQWVEAQLLPEFGPNIQSIAETRKSEDFSQVEVQLTQGRILTYQARFERREYTGFKSCKDFKGQKPESVKMDLLVSLDLVSQTHDYETLSRDELESTAEV